VILGGGTAQLVRAMVLGEDLPFDPAPFDPHRFDEASPSTDATPDPVS
jgi:glycine/D-amino acid oxidase-like deaminating enzyme